MEKQLFSGRNPVINFLFSVERNIVLVIIVIEYLAYSLIPSKSYRVTLLNTQ